MSLVLSLNYVDRIDHRLTRMRTKTLRTRKCTKWQKVSREREERRTEMFMRGKLPSYKHFVNKHYTRHNKYQDAVSLNPVEQVRLCLERSDRMSRVIRRSARRHDCLRDGDRPTLNHKRFCAWKTTKVIHRSVVKHYTTIMFLRTCLCATSA